MCRRACVSCGRCARDGCMSKIARVLRSTGLSVPPAGMTNKIRHFLDLAAIDAAGLRHILDRAASLKAERAKGQMEPLLKGKKLAMIFEKNSTRTRVSFEVAMMEPGGHAVYLNGNDLQLG